MIIAACVLYFDHKKYDHVEKLLKKYKNIDEQGKDIENGQMVITIEAENNKDLEDIEKELRSESFITGLAFHAFHFGEEVEKVLQGGIVPDFDVTKPFTRKKLL